MSDILDFGYYNMDCIEGMKHFPDKYFDLAIVDPPYGGGGKTDTGGQSVSRTGRGWAKKYGDKIANWDYAPGEEYFKELFRVSKNQIIWGGNYFNLPPNRCFIVWRKTNIPENFTMSMIEYAWCSMNRNAKLYECSSTSSERFHPTQKPVRLYEWTLDRFSEKDAIILDTHVGSASSLIACKNTGHKFVGFEIDPIYYEQSKKRYEEATAQMTIADFM